MRAVCGVRRPSTSAMFRLLIGCCLYVSHFVKCRQSVFPSQTSKPGWWKGEVTPEPAKKRGRNRNLAQLHTRLEIQNALARYIEKAKRAAYAADEPHGGGTAPLEPLLASHSRAVQLSLSGDVATGAGCTMRSRRSCAGSCPSCACRRSRLVSSPEAQSRQLRPRRVVLLPRPLSRAREAPQ